MARLVSLLTFLLFCKSLVLLPFRLRVFLFIFLQEIEKRGKHKKIILFFFFPSVHSSLRSGDYHARYLLEK